MRLSHEMMPPFGLGRVTNNLGMPCQWWQWPVNENKRRILWYLEIVNEVTGCVRDELIGKVGHSKYSHIRVVRNLYLSEHDIELICEVRSWASDKTLTKLIKVVNDISSERHMIELDTKLIKWSKEDREGVVRKVEKQTSLPLRSMGPATAATALLGDRPTIANVFSPTTDTPRWESLHSSNHNNSYCSCE